MSIEPLYLDYNDIVEEFGREKIESRYEVLLSALDEFIKKMEYTDSVFINETLLMYSLLDYFADISRVKSFHKIKRVNEIKITAYETYWLLKRKPLQIESKHKEYAFVNEQFALSHIVSFLVENRNSGFELMGSKNLDFFANTLFYFLKYRLYDAQTIELFLLSFKAGYLYHKKLHPAEQTKPAADSAVSGQEDSV
jgi:hypothetical protein